MVKAIEINNVRKSFTLRKNLAEAICHPLAVKRKVLALDGIDLEVNQGEVFALLGPNGAGKTTLIKLICGLILPTHGTIKVMGFDMVKQAYKAKMSLGLLTPEERTFYWRLSVRENLEFYATLFNLSQKEARQRIEELRQFLGIDNLDINYQECSTGMRQKIAIARSLLNSPRVLLMDEPTRSLDPRAATKFRKFIREKLVIQKGCTVLIATHQIKEAEDIADRIGIINYGGIVANGSLNELRINKKDSSLEDIFMNLTR